ncbi:hypothetical protein TL16_g07062 [Triparma laevis f. inornata]|uniref:Uncharacterized protein n=1 Tax=Triparma laevis f. inornata TaxID=1714386 RepID=A0A9W7AQB6_9STRA|nr:hypothetical protein TL16_g07062 [Triparma laevis f. inornata]
MSLLILLKKTSNPTKTLLLSLPSLIPHFKISVEQRVYDALTAHDSSFSEHLTVFTPYNSPPPSQIITIGGDGLLLYVSQIFQKSCPPILPIAGGTLGFLTPHSKENMLNVILSSSGHTPNDSTTPIKLTLRMRLYCRIYSSSNVIIHSQNVLNECSIHRSTDYLTSLLLTVDSESLAPVQADGIILSTPTGSTAYSMAAGGSVVHPGVAGICVQPICPHVLSFRGMVFPDYCRVVVEAGGGRGD